MNTDIKCMNTFGTLNQNGFVVFISGFIKYISLNKFKKSSLKTAIKEKEI